MNRLRLLIPLLALICLGCQNAPATAVPSQTAVPVPSAIPIHTPSVSPVPTQTAAPTSTIVPSTTPVINEFGYPAIIDARGHTMIQIPVGTFTMGLSIEEAADLCTLQPVNDTCGPDTPYASNLVPAFEVTIDTPFWIDQFEVTNAQYQACVDAYRCDPPNLKGSYWRDSYYGNAEFARYPVVNVTWFDAKQFCETWRTGSLPTEGQWEYAARSTDQRLWPWGDQFPTDSLANFVPYQEFGEGVDDTTPVDSYPEGVSPFGIYNMAGNVSEWTASWFTDYPYDALQDTEFAVTREHIIVRGGSYGFPELAALTVQRLPTRPNKSYQDLGFRCVRSANP